MCALQNHLLIRAITGADKLLGLVGADRLLHKGLEQVRELNQRGLLPTLSELDQRVLQPIFVADDASDKPQQNVELATQVRLHQSVIEAESATNMSVPLFWESSAAGTVPAHKCN